MKTYFLPLLLSAVYTPTALSQEASQTNSSTYDPAILLTNLESQRSAWNTHSIQNYSFDYERKCFCPLTFTGPFHITVRDNSVVSVQHTNTDLVGEPVPSTFEIMCADTMFDFLYRTLQKPPEAMPAGLEVTYNDVYGFPNSIKVDQITQMTDEIEYKIDSFTDDTNLAGQ